MAISSVSLTSNAIGAGAAQTDGAQKNPLIALQRKDASASTQLSPFGKTKLSLDDLKASAQAIRNLNNPPTFSDFKIAVQGFVQSLNALNKTVNDVSANDTAKSASLADTRPAQALNEIRKAVSGPAEGALTALQKLGVSSQKDGTFALNQRQLEKSFQENRGGTLSTLFEVAGRVEIAADQQLSGKKPVESAASSAEKTQEERDGERDTQARLENRKNFQQLLAAQLANAGSYVARNAVATYFSVAAL